MTFKFASGHLPVQGRINMPVRLEAGSGRQAHKAAAEAKMGSNSPEIRVHGKVILRLLCIISWQELRLVKQQGTCNYTDFCPQCGYVSQLTQIWAVRLRSGVQQSKRGRLGVGLGTSHEGQPSTLTTPHLEKSRQRLSR